MVTIKTYSEQYKSDFIRLNTEWIRTWFDLEESDLHTFANIYSDIIGGGGGLFHELDAGALPRDLVITLIINYLPMQTIILIDNQLVTASVVQIWFRKKGVYLVTNRTEN